jgi:CBS domain-containing protein
MRCPFCGSGNIPGVDVCESCGSELAGLDLPEASRGFSGRLLTDRISDLDLQDPVAVAPDDSVADTVSRMRERRAGCALVVEEGRLIGLFNERHLLTRVARPGLNPANTRVADVMTTDLVPLDPDDPPAYAVHCMVSRSFRHLPVVKGDELIGFLSVRTILGYLHRDLISG